MIWVYVVFITAATAGVVNMLCRALERPAARRRR